MRPNDRWLSEKELRALDAQDLAWEESQEGE
jgi:hypothetical protein